MKSKKVRQKTHSFAMDLHWTASSLALSSLCGYDSNVQVTKTNFDHNYTLTWTTSATFDESAETARDWHRLIYRAESYHCPTVNKNKARANCYLNVHER